MSLATADRKPAARRALERPYERDNERSVERTMLAAQMPKGLDALVLWFRHACSEEVPTRLHKGGVWRDFGQDAEGGSYIGSPATTDAFRRFIEGSPHATDEDGLYQKPLRAALARLNHRWPFMAWHLYRLALVDGDWRRYAEAATVWEREEMSVYIEAALRRLWIEYRAEVVRLS